MIKIVHDELKRWGSWASVSTSSYRSPVSPLLTAVRRARVGVSYGNTQSDETKQAGVDLKHRAVSCPKCGNYPLKVGMKCNNIVLFQDGGFNQQNMACNYVVKAGDHDHKLSPMKDTVSRISHLPQNSDPKAEEIDRLLSEFKRHHSRLKYDAVEQKYRHMATDQDGSERLKISRKTYTGYINDVQYWLDGRLRAMQEAI